MRWILFIAQRYFKSQRDGRKMTSSLFSITGLAVGVMTLITVIGVMNGFQYGFIDSILEIRSYHIRISGGPPEAEELKRLRQRPEVRAVLPFTEAQTIFQGRFQNPRGGLVRGVPLTAGVQDEGFVETLNVVEGSFHLEGSGKIIMGQQMARRLGLMVGDSVSLMALGGEGFSLLSPQHVEFQLTGIFKSGFYEYDSSLGIISLKDSLKYFNSPRDVTTGLKLKHRYRDQAVLHTLRKESPWSGRDLQSWREYNRAFFGALRTEKIMMMVVIGLIFVVVAVNIFHMFRRVVQERREELALLKAVGGGPSSIRLIFILDGLLIGIISGAAGTALGLFVSNHINGFFIALEGFLNGFLTLVSPLLGGQVSRVTLYSSGAFYMEAIPSRLFLPEVLLIALFAVAASTLAAWAASFRISRIKPSQVLRYE